MPPTSLAELKRDGVTVKILTGDNELVARHVCRSIGLDEQQIVTGDEIERIDDAALGHVAEQASVFARVSPAQKNRIILALKRRGHVVGFMGDGINDAPSLHAADVGISVMTRRRRRARRGGHHPRPAEPATCCTAGSSKAAGPSAT